MKQDTQWTKFDENMNALNESQSFSVFIQQNKGFNIKLL